MNVTHITTSLSRSAAGVFLTLQRLSQCLSEARVKIDILGVSDVYFELDKPLWSPIIPIACPPEFPYIGGYAPEMLAQLNKLNPEIVHSHGIWSYQSLIARLWAQKNRRPYIVSPHGTLEPWAWQHNSWKKKPVWWLCEKKNLANAAVLHATSQAEADSLRHLGLKNPIAIIPIGTDVPDISTKKVNKSRRTALFLSRIHPKKGILNLIEAWKRVQPVGWDLVLVGPDDRNHLHEVKAAIVAAGLSECISYAGPAKDAEKWDFYFSADLFILPSFSENFGLVIAEALAAEVPVITTTSTPWKDLVDYSCGWWIDVGVEPLVKALVDACSKSSYELNEMGQKGRELIKHNYSWSRAAIEMKSVYDWILNDSAMPSCIYK